MSTHAGSAPLWEWACRIVSQATAPIAGGGLLPAPRSAEARAGPAEEGRDPLPEDPACHSRGSAYPL